MGTLDYIVIALFAIAMIGIVVWVFKQKQKSSGDFFLAGRDATWLAIGASIFASNIGSEHLIGLAGAGASSGMAIPEVWCLRCPNSLKDVIIKNPGRFYR